MSASAKNRFNLGETFAPTLYYLKRPLRLFQEYDRDNFRPDLIAGLTVAVILLPQAIAFSIVAGLPPEMGLYSAVIGAIFGALWGSSNQMHTGPANAISLMVFSGLSGAVPAGAAEFVVAAGVMAVMVGVFQTILGMIRLGMLVNFVSHSVIVGFTTGAGILIAIKQLEPLLGMSLPASHTYETPILILQNIAQTHLPSAEIGIGTMVFIVVVRRLNRRLPVALLSMIVASLVVFFLRLDKAGVSVIGQIPSGFPPLAGLPLFDLELISRLSTGAFAVASIGLVESMAIARSMAAQTGQRIDSNQEFVGQGISNVLSGFFSGYPIAGSFSRSAVNFNNNAKTPVASLISGVFVLIAMLVLGPLAAYLPVTALSGVLIITAYGMIDGPEMKRIWESKGGDAVIMVITLVGTLFLAIEFAVLIGIMLSLTLYILRTSTPKVHAVVPDSQFRHFFHQPDRDECPQLGVIEILGDLYFGAVQHVEEFILDYAANHPEQHYLLLRMHNVNHCDFSGIHFLESIVKAYREKGGDVFLVRMNPRVREIAKSSHFDEYIGADHYLEEDIMIGHIFYHVLDPAICIYECPVRVFKECQNLPKRIDVVGIPHFNEVPTGSVLTISSQQLWEQIHHQENGKLPMVIDVREPREFKRSHIAEAASIPLSEILSDKVKLPNDRSIVLVCRTGRRSRRAAYALQNIGCMNVFILEGGMKAWEASKLLAAVE
ncbi:MAG: sulfate permease [Anaerolineales bacterium]|nr:sulfate permease [Anaerolineales bacterium]MCA9928182.1 sulfate permease [Anaerolineales bacterium]